MNKKYIIALVVGVVVLIGGFTFFKLKSSSLEKVYKEASAYTSYELVCNMEMLDNDELKSYQVTTTFATIDDQDYFKVELYDKSLNQAQTIVRNSEGVFVLTPSLNQAFQFQSEWPMNSPKPYIYQSLLSFLDSNQAEKVKDGYLVNGDMTYENDERIKTQEVKFDKELNPVYVNVYDDAGVEIIQLTVTSFEANQNIGVENFQQETIMKSNQSQYTSVASALPLYPVALMGSTLENEKVSQIDNMTNHILKFTGDKSFTIIESSSESEDMTVEVVSGDLIDLVDGIAFEGNNQMTYLSSGVVCSIYSNDLTRAEMISVLTSMQSSQVK